nr:hypothetical protein StreXyl84_63500 [Streptomyces sp. Xyl84]
MRSFVLGWRNVYQLGQAGDALQPDVSFRSPVNDSVPAPGASDGNAPGARGEFRVVGEVGDQFAGAGGVEVEDVAGGGWVAEPVTDVFDAVSGRRRASLEVQVAERDQAYRVHGRVPLSWAGCR